MERGELKSECGEDNKYREVVVVPTDWSRGRLCFYLKSGLENSITDAYEAAAKQSVHHLVIQHKLKVIDYNYTTITFLEDKLKEGNVRIIHLEWHNQDMVHTVTQMSCELEALKARLVNLEKENKGLSQELYNISKLDEKFVTAQKRL